MKAICLISGGKDSFLSLLIGISVGMEIELAITVEAKTDSYMFHYQNATLGGKIAQTMGINSVLVGESQLERFISQYKGYFLIAGAVESEFQKTRLEALCQEFGLIPYFPLWRKDQESIFKEFISTGAKGIFISVSAEGLDSGFLRKQIDQDSLNILKRKREKYGISIIGEGGEYETLVTSYPPTGKLLEILDSEEVDRGMQKILQITKFEIIPLP